MRLRHGPGQRLEIVNTDTGEPVTVFPAPGDADEPADGDTWVYDIVAHAWVPEASGAGHTEDHDHDGSPTQKLLAANSHESPSADTHHAKQHSATDGAHHTFPGGTSDFLRSDGSFATPPGGTGHIVQDDNSSMTARSKLSFQDGFVVTDDAGGDQTEIDLAYQVTPSTQAFADAAAAGTAIETARGDHKHAMMANPVTGHEAASDPHTGYMLETLAAAKGDIFVASANDTPAILTAGANDEILMADSGAGTGLKWVASQTPSTQAFGDAAATGTADTFNRGDHKHAMPVNPVTGHEAASDPHTGYVRESWNPPPLIYNAGSQTITSSGFVNLTNMSFAIAASEIWIIEFMVIYRVSTTAMGMRFAINGPSGGGINVLSRKEITLASTASTDKFSEVGLTVFDTPNPVSTAEADAATNIFWVGSGLAYAAATPGNIALRWDKENVAGTGTHIASYMRYERAA